MNLKKNVFIILIVVIILVIGLMLTRGNENSTVKASITPKSLLASASPLPKVSSAIQDSQMSSWFYPNAQTVESHPDELQLSSLDDPESVTQWYKNSILSQGFSSKSFITTNSNNTTINQLVGSSGNREVNVEIKRFANSHQTLITISINS